MEAKIAKDTKASPDGVSASVDTVPTRNYCLSRFSLS